MINSEIYNQWKLLTRLVKEEHDYDNCSTYIKRVIDKELCMAFGDMLYKNYKEVANEIQRSKN